MSGDITTPDQVIEAINAANDVLDDGPAIVAAAETLRDSTARALVRQRATLRLSVSGSSEVRREAKVAIESEQWQAAADEARVAFNYARASVDAAEKRLSGQQTIARIVLAAMGVRS